MCNPRSILYVSSTYRYGLRWIDMFCILFVWPLVFEMFMGSEHWRTIWTVAAKKLGNQMSQDKMSVYVLGWTQVYIFAVVSVVGRVFMLVDGCNFLPTLSTWRIIVLVLKLSVYQRCLPFCYKDKWSKKCRSSRGTWKGRLLIEVIVEWMFLVSHYDTVKSM